jgi:hypothetical protein
MLASSKRAHREIYTPRVVVTADEPAILRARAEDFRLVNPQRSYANDWEG